MDSSGTATIFGADSYVVKTIQPADVLLPESPLTVFEVEVYKFNSGSQFQMTDFDPADEPEIYLVEEGKLQIE